MVTKHSGSGVRPYCEEGSQQGDAIRLLAPHTALLDRAGRILAVSPSWTEFHWANQGVSSSACLDSNYLEVCDRATGPSSEGAREAAQGIRQVLAGQAGRFQMEYPCHSPREFRWFLMEVRPVLAEGAVEGATVYHLDITPRKLAEEDLKASEARLMTMFNHLPVGIAIVDPVSRTIEDANPMALSLLEANREELIGTHCFHFLCSQGEESCPLLAQHEECRNEEFLLQTARGHTIPVLKNTSRYVSRGSERIMVSFLDVSEQRKLQEELRRQAATDDLTGLANRRHFMLEAARELDRSKRYGSPLCLMIVDVDDFKRINDTFGHATGDRVLRGISGIISQSLRANDISGRIGGEEFAMLLVHSGHQEGLLVAERLRAAVADHSFVSSSSHTFHCTLSAGLTFFIGGPDSLEDIMRRADEALYAAKAKGKNQVLSRPAPTAA